MTIGIPRALLFYYYEELWVNFFRNINTDICISPPTNKAIVKQGVKLSIDEACFSSKIFIGHVDYLVNETQCDKIFIPRIENTAIREEYCTRIFGLYDLAHNTFPGIDILHAEVNYLFRRRESTAFVEIGKALGKSEDESLSAYKAALTTAEEIKTARIKEQEELLSGSGIKILIVGHAYNAEDAYIGKEVTDFFRKNNIKIAYADLIDHSEAKEHTKRVYGKRIYWRVTGDLMGGLDKYKDQADGIVLLSTFPCGPDSLFNELLIRQIKDKPILSLVIDEQDAQAGVITRLESFIDIISANINRKAAV